MQNENTFSAASASFPIAKHKNPAMAEPISLLATIDSLIKICDTIIPALKSLAESSNSARATLASLADECNITATVLRKLESSLTHTPLRVDFKIEFEAAVEGVFKNLATIREEVARVGKSKSRGIFEFLTKAKTVKEDVMKIATKEMRDERENLGYLIERIQT